VPQQDATSFLVASTWSPRRRSICLRSSDDFPCWAVRPSARRCFAAGDLPAPTPLRPARILDPERANWTMPISPPWPSSGDPALLDGKRAQIRKKALPRCPALGYTYRHDGGADAARRLLRSGVYRPIQIVRRSRRRNSQRPATAFSWNCSLSNVECATRRFRRN
jgi:hypothetical protein